MLRCNINEALEEDMEQSTISTRANLDRAMRPYALTLGLASPMWMAYGAAASVGTAWWWMSRMTRFVAPQRVQAVVAEPVETMFEAPPPMILTTALAEPEPVTEPIEAIIETPLEAVEETVLATPEPIPEPLFERPDELTLLRGVGPRVADALVSRGVTKFAQLAAWSDHDMARFDKELKLLGRSTRYDFLGQARALAEL